MNRMLGIIWVLLMGVTSVCAQQQDTLRFAHFNTENLFDTEDDPAIDDAEFLPSSKLEWTPERYSIKLGKIEEVFEALGFPDVISLCEVENMRVLEDLLKQPKLAKLDYQIVHRNSPDGRGIDVAFLVRKQFGKPVNVVGKGVDLGPNSFPTRDILVLQVKSGKHDFFFTANHWPSRRGGESSSAKRMAAARAALSIVDSLGKKFPQAPLVMMGDFNDTPQDTSIRLVLLEGKEKSWGFNSFFSLAEQGEGTHFYRGEYSMLDQIICSKQLENGKHFSFVPGSARVHRFSFMTEQDGKYKGAPKRTYVGNKYMGGYSDHFPVSIQVLRKKP
jgi:predicted extracellular nuclease